jgi:class 3 adenylate cyclase
MAAFGAPVESVDHADRALAAAIDMTTGVADSTAGSAPRHRRWVRDGVGLNSGRVMSAPSARRRFDYAVIGDTVSTAARIEQLTKQTGNSVLVATRRGRT